MVGQAERRARQVEERDRLLRRLERRGQRQDVLHGPVDDAAGLLVADDPGTPPIDEMSTARPYVCAETRRGAFLLSSLAVWATKRE